MHILDTLHGVEASTVSLGALCKLRTAFVRSVWSFGLHLANPGAVLSLLDGPVGCDPGYHVVWSRFRMLRRHMAYNSGVHDLARIFGLLRVVVAGAPGHGPLHLLVSSAASIGLFGFQSYVFGRGLVCLLFVSFLVLFSFSKLLFGRLGRLKFP